MSNDTDKLLAKTGRVVALVIAAAAVLSILAPNIAEALGIGVRGEMLIYLISLAAFIWSLVVTWKLWQKTRDE